MGLFDFLKKQVLNPEPRTIYAPTDGEYIPLAKLPDPVFAEGYLGEGCGFVPESGKVFAPESGKIEMVADTLHAIGITGDSGAEYLIHIGMDTVVLKGRGFHVKVKANQRISAGQLLMTFDTEQLLAEGCVLDSALIITNYDEFPALTIQTGKHKAGSPIGKL